MDDDQLTVLRHDVCCLTNDQFPLFTRIVTDSIRKLQLGSSRSHSLAKLLLLLLSLAICHPSGCTVASGVVGVVVVGVCNRSQMRTSKYACLIFGVSIGLDPGYKSTKGIFDRSQFKVTRTDHLWMASSCY